MFVPPGESPIAYQYFAIPDWASLDAAQFAESWLEESVCDASEPVPSRTWEILEGFVVSLWFIDWTNCPLELEAVPVSDALFVAFTEK